MIVLYVILKMKKAFYGILGTGVLLLILSTWTMSPAKTKGIAEEAPLVPSTISSFSGLVIVLSFLGLACIATYYAIKNLNGIKMVVSVLLSWVLPVVGPCIVFAISHDSEKRKV